MTLDLVELRALFAPGVAPRFLDTKLERVSHGEDGLPDAEVLQSTFDRLEMEGWVPTSQARKPGETVLLFVKARSSNAE